MNDKRQKALVDRWNLKFGIDTSRMTLEEAEKVMGDRNTEKRKTKQWVKWLKRGGH